MMNKEEALAAMVAGNKVRHQYYMSFELIYLDEDMSIRDEGGISLGTRDDYFWRKSQRWDWGWEIVKND